MVDATGDYNLPAMMKTVSLLSVAEDGCAREQVAQIAGGIVKEQRGMQNKVSSFFGSMFGGGKGNDTPNAS